MLFKVEMKVAIPHDMPQEKAEQIKAREKEYCLQLQREGKWRHIWRIAGKYENISIFDVRDNTELHEILSALPLFPYMEMTVEPLCRHLSSIHEDDK